MGRVFFNTRKNVQSLVADYQALAGDTGSVFAINIASGMTLTLPAISDALDGWNCKFIVGTAFDTSNWAVTATAAVMKGGINEQEIDTSDDQPFTTGGTSIDFVHSLETIGDYVDLMCDGTTIFFRGQAKLDGGILLA